MYNEDHRKRSGLPVQRHNTSLSMKVKEEDGSPLIKKVLISSLIGMGVNLGCGIILVTICCMFALLSDDPLALLVPLALLSLLVSNFMGGFVSSKIAKEAPLACGLITAATWGLLSVVSSLCLYTAPSSGYALWQGLLLHAMSAGFSILGALTGSYKPKKNPKKHRRFGK